MTSLRKRVTSYFRQLSFHNELREKKTNVSENSFITKYLLGQIKLKDGPPVLYGKSPNDLPNFELGTYSTGTETIVGCATGPNGGLTTVKRVEKHLSVTDPDIDFIDTQEEIAETKRKSPVRAKRPLDNTTMVIKVAGQEYKVTNRKSRSLGSLTDLTVDAGDNNTASNVKPVTTNNNHEISNIEHCVKNKNPADCDRQISTGDHVFSNENHVKDNCETNSSNQKNFSLSKSKSECNPFEHRKKGKIIRLTERPQAQGAEESNSSTTSRLSNDDAVLPKQWNRKTDLVYGIVESLYDVNQVTKCKNGNPIADCYGIIARSDSAILALADGVNWGEKACIAAKSAVHGCIHYLNKTIFDDTSLFDFDSTNKSDNFDFYPDQDSPINTTNISMTKGENRTDNVIGFTSKKNENRISNTTEVFISLLRAFNCAHNLILENQGMLTTLTVAVVLPLKSSNYQRSQRSVKTETGTKSRENVKKMHAPHTTQKKENVNKEANFRRNYRQSPPVSHNQNVQVKASVTKVETNENVKCEKYICCVCNVGDTLAYVYSQKYGVRELTRGSHDVYFNRDMRDALGALGPVDGINPELNNLTLSVTTLDAGDIIMVASDGLTDNYDPTVCKYSVNSVTSDNSKLYRSSQGNFSNKERQPLRQNITPSRESKPSRERKSSTPSKPKDHHTSTKMNPPSNVSRLAKDSQLASSSGKLDASFTKNKENDPKSSGADVLEYEIIENPLIAQFLSDNSLNKKPSADNDIPEPRRTKSENSSQSKRSSNNLPSQKPKRVSMSSVLSENQNKEFSPLSKSSSTSGVFKSRPTSNIQKYGFLRSKTSLDFQTPAKVIHRNEDGLPYVTPIQRYELTLLLIEDILKRGISGKERQCTTAKVLCENLLRYTVSVTAAKRRTLEDMDLYFDNKNDILVEISQKEKKMRRKRCLEKVQNLPGKLDHVSVVAYNVGNKSLADFS